MIAEEVVDEVERLIMIYVVIETFNKGIIDTGAVSNA